MRDFKVGDVVYLKGYVSRFLVVEKDNGETLTCVFFLEGNSTLCREEFVKETLSMIEPVDI